MRNLQNKKFRVLTKRAVIIKLTLPLALLVWTLARTQTTSSAFCTVKSLTRTKTRSVVNKWKNFVIQNLQKDRNYFGSSASINTWYYLNFQSLTPSFLSTPICNLLQVLWIVLFKCISKIYPNLFHPHCHHLKVVFSCLKYNSLLTAVPWFPNSVYTGVRVSKCKAAEHFHAL